jgi:hypothetical protein
MPGVNGKGCASGKSRTLTAFRCRRRAALMTDATFDIGIARREALDLLRRFRHDRMD